MPNVCPRNGESIHYPRFGCDLKRLHDTTIAIRYQDEMIDDAAYECERDAIRAKLTTASTSLPFAVAALLGDLPALFKEATNEERRAVLVQLVDQVYLRYDAILGIRPMLRAWPLMYVVYTQSLHSVTWWAGWAPGPNSPPPVKNPSDSWRCIGRSRARSYQLQC